MRIPTRYRKIETSLQTNTLKNERYRIRISAEFIDKREMQIALYICQNIH